MWKNFRLSQNIQNIYERDKVENLYWMPMIFRPSETSIKNSCDPVREITAWAQERFQKSHSSPCATQEYRLTRHHAKKKPFVNMIYKHHHLLRAKADK